MPLNDWMGAYQDRKLGEMHLPGAHDAGTAKGHIDLTAFATNSNSATQTRTIPEMLTDGTRFFDLRLKSHKKGSVTKVVAHHTTAGQGAFSQHGVDEVLAAVATWWDNHKTEVVIFRISHTDSDTNAHNLAKASGGAALHKGEGNLCNKTLAEIARDGGVVCIFDQSKFGNFINQKQGIHSFAKYKDNPANDHGISCCGCYEGTHKLQKVFTNALQGRYDHNEKHGHRLEHLWQVYWQKTYTNPASSTGIESGTTKKSVFRIKDGKVHGGTHASTAFMIKLMEGDISRFDDRLQGVDAEVVTKKKTILPNKTAMYSTLAQRNWTMPNIFSYDFVDEATNTIIIAMNDKGTQRVEVI